MNKSDIIKLTAVLSVFAAMTAFTAGCAKSSETSSQVSGTSAQSSVSDAAATESTVSNAESTAESTADSSSESTIRPANSDSVVGKWASEMMSGSFVYTFNEDGTGSYDMMGTVVDLNYSIEGDKITITLLAEGYTPMTLNYEIKDNKLNIKDSFGNDTFYIRQ